MSTNIRVQKICEGCGSVFTARTTVTRYCSHKCNSRHSKHKIRELKVELSNIQFKESLQKPIELIKAKPFLSIAETCKLLGISRRTVYRMLERGQLTAGKAGKRTLIQRSEIDKLFPSNNHGS